MRLFLGVNILANIFFSAPTGAPTGVSVTSAQSDTAIVVQWMPPELFERNGPIVSYHTNLTYSNGTQQRYTSSGNTFSLQIEGVKFKHLANVQDFFVQVFPNLL